MKVLQVNAVNGISSTGRTCSEIARYMNEHGEECFTAYSKGTQMPGAYRIAATWECKSHGLLSRLTGLQGYYSYVSTNNLINLIRKINPDVVHLNNLHANYLNLNKLLKYLAQYDIPTVITLHDCWVFTGKCTHYTSVGCDRWQTGCHDCCKLKDDHKSWFFDQTPKMWADKKRGWLSIPRLAVIGVSDWITNEAKKSPMFANAKMISRIYNWIDLDVFRPIDATNIREKLGCSEKKIILGVASVWSNKKGLDKFIALADYLSKDEVILLVGNMPDVRLPTNMISISATSDVNELAAYYSAADVFLQLSEEETFGKVVAEALACGTPVITNQNTANPELVSSESGVVLGEARPEEIAKAVREILETGKSSYTQSCVRFARENFDSTKNIPAYIALYKEILKTKDR